MLDEVVIQKVKSSVLCWLATVSAEGQPSVSPKEIFATIGTDTIVIANIASPTSAKNIVENPRVCVSFIDILIQKGFQVFGEATVVKRTMPTYDRLAEPLLAMTKGRYPFGTIFEVRVTAIKPIIAPSYRLYPETKEADQIASAKSAYQLLVD